MSNEASSRGEPLAFFYCANSISEPERGEADEILRCILKQLLLVNLNLPIMESVRKTYENFKTNGLRKLNPKQSTHFIVELAKIYPSFTIVIDAFEECDPRTSLTLGHALEEIVKLSGKPVKVFISSRSHDNIPRVLKDWPQICITEKDNAEDIKNFIHHQVEQSIQTKRMLEGSICPELRQHLIVTLTEGAQGM